MDDLSQISMCEHVLSSLKKCSIPSDVAVKHEVRGGTSASIVKLYIGIQATRAPSQTLEKLFGNDPSVLSRPQNPQQPYSSVAHTACSRIPFIVVAQLLPVKWYDDQ